MNRTQRGKVITAKVRMSALIKNPKTSQAARDYWIQKLAELKTKELLGMEITSEDIEP